MTNFIMKCARIAGASRRVALRGLSREPGVVGEQRGHA